MIRFIKNSLALLLGLALGGFLVVQSARAGYFATVTASGSALSSALPVGRVSGCYLTPSMAVYANAGGGGLEISSMDSSGNWAGYWYSGIGQSAYAASGTYGACTVAPLVGAIPTFIGAASDPAITGTSVLGGAGGSSSSSSSTIVPLTVDQLTSMGFDAGDVTAVMLTMMSIVLAFWKLGVGYAWASEAVRRA